MRAQLEHSLSDINDPNRVKGKMGWFDWMDLDIEEAAARKKKDKEKTVLDSLPKKDESPQQVRASLCAVTHNRNHHDLALIDYAHAALECWI